MRKRLTVDEYTGGILSGDRVLLSRAITVVESYLPSDRILAKEILRNILPHSGKSVRIGVTGVPGVGKSTFVETFGKYLTSIGKKVGVLTVDPSSKNSGGSILGDKTRMEMLARDPMAYVRPSATGNFLGGVADKTREVMLVCEAAGYNVMLIETVGVGQSETLVHGMTDFFLLLMLAGAGDELQGVKKGIMEMADVVAINKADGTNKLLADQAVITYENALHLARDSDSGWHTKVMTCSGLHGTGVADLWDTVQAFLVLTSGNGYFQKNRQEQNVAWLHDLILRSLEQQFYSNPKIKKELALTESRVREMKELPVTAVEELLKLFLGPL